MAGKADTAHVEGVPDHEAALTGAVALANLFNNCVEAFGLIHPTQRWDKKEQLLLSMLGLQQARLLIWGDLVGISSPPKTVTDRAVPKYPGSAYPDLKEPTFFLERKEKIDDPETRMTIEDALSSLVDRAAHQTREEMMNKFGLKPPKRMMPHFEPALDTNRLEAFREKYELLQEVCETYAQINTRRANSIIQTSWQIADTSKFASFVALTEEKVDFLIDMFNAKDGVDRGMRMDIRAFGWHLSTDRTRLARDVSKLRLIAEACGDKYPVYVEATKEALANITRETRENSISPYAVQPMTSGTAAASAEAEKAGLPQSNGGSSKAGTGQAKAKRPGLLGGLMKSFRNSRNKVPRSKSVSAPGSAHGDPSRTQSDAGQAFATTDPNNHSSDGYDFGAGNSGGGEGASLEPIRSKSVGDILDAPVNSLNDELAKAHLARVETAATYHEPLDHSEGIVGMISRHDQYHGIGRVATRDQRQGEE